MTLDRRVIALEAGVLAAAVVSIWNLSTFVQGMLSMQDLWNGSDYVRLLAQGFLAAAAGLAAGEVLRRADKNAKDGLGPVFVFVGRAVFAAQVLALLYCNSGPFRSIAYTVLRLLVTFGMARDLPEPPPSGSV